MASKPDLARPAGSPAGKGGSAVDGAAPDSKPQPSPAAAAAEPGKAFVIEQGRVRLSMSTAAAGAILAAVIVAFIGVWALAHSGGRAAERGDRAAALTEDASRAMQAAATSDDSAEPAVVREPSPLVLLDPPPEETTLRLDRPLPADRSPANNAEEVAPDQAAFQDAPPAEPEQSRADEAGSDTREAGLNYLALGQLADAAEARRTVDFLRANGVPALAVEGRDRAGNTQYRLFTLLGVPGAGFRSNPERIQHQQRVFELGERWIAEERGQLDFSRPSQVQWTKYNP
ncbi:MAG: hypothetical protein AAGF47_01690 [Planctomycetota bacterium]